MPTLYDILGLTNQASQADIKSAYKRLAFQYHPDVNPDNPQAEEKFKQINSAYQVLSDETLRSNYDFMINQRVYEMPVYQTPQPNYTQTNYTSSRTYQYRTHSAPKPNLSKKKIRIINISSIIFFIGLVISSILFGNFMNRFTGRMHFNQALEYLKKGKESRAYQELTEALKFYPTYLEAHQLNYKLSTDKKPTYLFAVSSMDLAIKYYPDMAILYFKRGFAYLKMKRYRQALKDLKQATKINPQNAKYWFYLGVAQQETLQNNYCQTWTKARKRGSKLARIYQNFYCE